MKVMPDEATRGDVRYRLSKKAKVMPNGCIEFIGSKSAKGYGRLTVLGGPRLVPRLKYELEFGEIPDGMHVCHKCDNPACFNIEHLFLGTNNDNFVDSYRKGRPVRWNGSDHCHAKLNEEQVKEIRIKCAKGLSLSSVAKQYGVSPGAIHHIVKRNTWTHVT